MKTALAVATGLLLQLSAFLALASDLPDSLTVDGEKYEQVRWGNATPSTVTIYHKTGIAAIPLEKLPAELQQHFGYDPQKAAAFRASERAALQAVQKQRIDQKSQSAAKQTKDAENQAEIAAYEADCKSRVLIGQLLVLKGREPKTIHGSIVQKRRDGTVLHGCLEEDMPFIAAGRMDMDDLFVLNFFPTEDIGKPVHTVAIRTNPIYGMPAYYIGGKTPTFEEWRGIQALIKAR